MVVEVVLRPLNEQKLVPTSHIAYSTQRRERDMAIGTGL